MNLPHPASSFGTRAAAPLLRRDCRGDPRAAFSLIEVMIAAAIFFLAIFTILALVTGTLRNARVLRRIDVDAGMVAAQLFKTNRVYEGTESGDFGDFYQDYSWATDTYEVATNGLWQVDIVVHRRGIQDPTSKMSVWVFSPDSSAVPFGGGVRR
jgi:Tfp pilus assembly protein PilV